MDKPKYLYWITMLLLTVIILFSICYYFFNPKGIESRFGYFSHPGYGKGFPHAVLAHGCTSDIQFYRQNNQKFTESYG